MASLILKIPVKYFRNSIKNFKYFSTKQKNKEKNYIIRRATENDVEPVLKLMRRAFYSGEPTTSSIAFKPNKLFINHAIQLVREGYSFVAQCKYNNDILGAALNEPTNCWDAAIKDQTACETDCEKARQLLHFYAHLQGQPNLWRIYGVQTIFEICYLFVRKDQRQQGIGTDLLQHSRVFGADCGFGLTRVNATSFYTAKLCERVKMKLVYEIPYCTFIGHDQQPIFRPPEPHKSAKVYIDDEPQKNALTIAKEIQS